MNTIQCVLLLAGLLSVMGSSTGSISTDNDMVCKSDLRINQLSMQNEQKSQLMTEEIHTGSLTVNSIKANTLIIGTLDVTSLNPLSTDGQIHLEGLLNFKNVGLLETSKRDTSAKSSAESTNQKSFIEITNSSKIKQWKLIVEEDLLPFGEKYAHIKPNINGWILGSQFRKQILDFELNRPIKSVETTKKQLETVILSKQYRGLSEHKQVMIDGVFHFASSVLGGKAIFIKIDGRLAWLEHNQHQHQNTLNCEGDLSHCNSDWATPINIIIPHSEENIKIEIGVYHKLTDNNECLIKRFSDYFQHCSNHFSLSTR